ncbi:MAG: hypothetical protein ABIA67_04910 [Candidatus Margulisiibacteriota bacterium]
MLDFITQNFNWPTFLIALGFFVLLSNIVRLIAAIIAKRRAQEKLKVVDSKYEELKAQLKAKDEEYNRVLGKKEIK